MSIRLPLLASGCIAVLLLAPAINAAPPKDVGPAPVPPQITAAKKVFIANAGEDPYFKELGRQRSYNHFYAAVKNWGRFELVSRPADADLILEICLAGTLDRYGDRLEIVPVLKLTIVDPATGILLWTLTEELETGSFVLVGSGRAGKFDRTMERMAKDLQALVGSPSSQARPEAAAGHLDSNQELNRGAPGGSGRSR